MFDPNRLFGTLGERASLLYLNKLETTLVKNVSVKLNGTGISAPDFIQIDKDLIGYRIKNELIDVEIIFPSGVEVKVITEEKSYGSIGNLFKKAEKQLAIVDYKIIHLHHYCDNLYKLSEIYLERRKTFVDVVILFLNGNPKRRIIMSKTQANLLEQPSIPKHGTDVLYEQT